MYDENSTSITDREMQALLAVGEILELGQDESWTGAGQDDDIPDLGPEVDPDS